MFCAAQRLSAAERLDHHPVGQDDLIFVPCGAVERSEQGVDVLIEIELVLNSRKTLDSTRSGLTNNNEITETTITSINTDIFLGNCGFCRATEGQFQNTTTTTKKIVDDLKKKGGGFIRGSGLEQRLVRKPVVDAETVNQLLAIVESGHQ